MAYVRKEIAAGIQPADGRKRPRSDGFKAKMRALYAGRKLTPEWIANRDAARRRNGKGMPGHVKEILRAANLGRPCPPLAIARSVAARKGKKLTPEHRAALVAAANRYPSDIRQAQRTVTKLRKAISEKQD